MRDGNGLPQGWAVATLGQVFEWSSGGTPDTHRREFFGGDIPWVNSGELQDSVLTEFQNTISHAGLANSSAKWVQPGAVLIAMYGATIGKLGIAGTRLTTNQAIAFTSPNLIETKYLFYYLLGRRNELVNLGKGAAQRNISQTVIKAFPFIVAPLAEQRRIVEAIEQQFTRLDAGVAALKRAQAALKRYRAAVLKAAVEGKLTTSWRMEHPNLEPASDLLQRILAERHAMWEASMRTKGKVPASTRYIAPEVPDATNLPELPKWWLWIRLGMVATLQGGFAFESKSYMQSGLRIVRMSNVRPSGLNWISTVYWNPELDFPLKRFLIKSGDVLVSMTGANIGMSSRVRDVDVPAILNQRVGRFIVHDSNALNSSYLFLFTQSPLFVKECTGTSNRNGASKYKQLKS